MQPLSFVISKTHALAQKSCRRQLNTNVCGSKFSSFFHRSICSTMITQPLKYSPRFSHDPQLIITIQRHNRSASQRLHHHYTIFQYSCTRVCERVQGWGFVHIFTSTFISSLLCVLIMPSIHLLYIF